MDKPQSTASVSYERPDDLSRAFGDRVRELRERADLTLDGLAGRSGVSRAMLSKVERGEKSPTIGVATRIAHALETSLSYLAGGQEERRTVAVVRRNQRHIFRDEESGFERHILSPTFASSRTELVYHHLPAGVSTGLLPAYAAGTEKYVVVTQGEITVQVGTVDHLLREGDAFFFEADIEHEFENRSAQVGSYYLFISRQD